MNSHNYYQQVFFENKLALINQGRELLDLSMINPDLEPAREILDKLVEFTVKPGCNKYAVSRGVRPLREAFAFKYNKSFDVQLSADLEVCVTQGAKDALLSTFSALFSPGDKILLPAPTYPGHLAAAHLAHMQIDFYPVIMDQELMLQALVEKIKVYKPRAVVLNFPNNPTGISVDSSFYSKLAENVSPEICLINDFVYGEMACNGLPSASLLAARDDKDALLEMYSLSKSYSLSGWRIAAIMGDAKLIKRISKYKSQVDYGIFLPLQFAATAAIQSVHEYPRQNAEVYAQRAKLLVKDLQSQGFAIETPSGGCSLWCKLPDTYQKTSMDFCLEFMNEYGVVLAPGELFELKPSRFIRIALVAKDFELLRLLESLRKMLP